MNAPANTGYTADSLVAAEKATTASNLSARALLEQIFGPIANDPLSALGGGAPAGDILGNIFMYVNMGLLTLGSIYLSYKALAAITQTAHDGDFMGKSFHSIWIPIRITTGVSSLIPVAGGWSLLQVFMLWFGIMGAGLGNMAWQGVVGAGFLPTKTLTLSPPTGGSFDRRFVPELFKMHACVFAHNAEIGDGGWGVNKQPETSFTAGSYTFGSNNGAGAECGKITLAATLVPLGQEAYKPNGNSVGSNYSGAWSGGLNALGVQSIAQKNAIRAAAQVQFDTLNDYIQKMADKFVNGDKNNGGDGGIALVINDPDKVTFINKPNPVMLRDISVKYQANLSTAIAGAMSATDALPAATQAMKEHATQDGFTTAGAWYMTMAQTSYAMNSLTQNVSPSIASTAQNAYPTDSVWYYAQQKITDSEKTMQEGTLNVTGSVGNQDSAWKLIMSQMGGDWKTSPGQSVVNSVITETSGEPVMIRVKHIADWGVGISSAVITAVGAVMGAFNDSIVGKMASMTPIGGALMGAAKPWLEMATFISQVAVGFFLMASIVIPMIPFIIFTGQILNWMITVVEGVAAAPFLGFAHLDTDGEGLGHKTEYGYVFMLQSFMRPVMLVLGFTFAAMLLEAIGGYVMAIYPISVANAQIDSITGFFSILGFIALFMIIMAGLINSCMSVTYLLPDAIFAFIGAHSSAMSGIGRDMGEKTTLAAGGAGLMTRQISFGRNKGDVTRNAQEINGLGPA